MICMAKIYIIVSYRIQVDLSKKHEADTADTYETWDDKMCDEVLPSLLNINCTQTPDSAFSGNDVELCVHSCLWNKY